MAAVRTIPAVLLVVAAATVGAAACGSGSGSPPSASTVTVTRTPGATAPSAATSGAAGAATGPAARRTATPAPSGTPAAPDAAMTVSRYVDAINAHDYRSAWDLGGRNLSSSYGAFVRGFATTETDVLAVTGSAGGTVSVTLDAVQSDGSVKSFAGTYTVRDGTIVAASIRQVARTSPTGPGAGQSSTAARHFANCTEAHRAGRYDIPRSDPAYAPHLDRDGDGKACEAYESPAP